MKFTKYILFISLLTFMSCSDDFLDRSSSEDINTSSFYKTQADALAAINAAYNPLQRPKLYNLRMWTTDIMAGNSEVGANPSDSNDGVETKNLAGFTTTTDNAGVLDLWRGPWPGILYSNIVLDRVPTIEMDADLQERILGEAYFLRATYYFILVRCFGDVPLITEPYWGDEAENARPSRTSKDLVYDQIIADYSKAIDLLPFRETYTGSDIGRASKGSAAGMLAKVFLTLGKSENNWNRVVSLCDTVNAWGYSLNTSYKDNFNPDAENTVESLFEIQYMTGIEADFWSDDNLSAWSTNYMGPRDSPLTTVGWGWNQPTQEFVNSYEEGDLRKDVTIFYDGCPLFDGKEYKPAYAYKTGYNVRKFVVGKSYIASTYNGSPLNFPVLRYADVLLMKAEALNELGRTDEAETPLNLVRDRAGLDPVSGLSKDDFRLKVLHERRMELAFEGDRWFDLIRIEDGQYGLDFLHSIGKTAATTKHLLLPIPLVDCDANPNLLPNNPGY
jgi:starch-binding outer membrane protein, SusD/RagB family